MKELQPWPASPIRRASVNSFGYGGTNAHVILDAYDPGNMDTSWVQPRERQHSEVNGNSHDSNSDSSSNMSHLKNQTKLILISHRTKAGVKRAAEDLRRYVTLNSLSGEQGFLESIAYSLGCRRTLFDWRATVQTTSSQELADALHAPTLEPSRILQDQRLSFIFTGQGAQWYAMGRELISKYEIFRSTLDFLDLHLQSLGASWSLTDELLKSKETSRVNSAAIGQPLCTAIQCALVDLLASWNVKPASVLGHSSGEIAAAYACGSLTLNSAISISYHRGLLASSILERNSKLRGAMMAAGISESDVMHFIRKIPSRIGRVVIACVNSPSSVTLSGDRPAIMSLQSALEARQIFVRRLAVGTAYHSHHMETIAESYLAAMRGLPLPKPNTSVTFISSVTGGIMNGEGLDAAYWVRNMVSQVKFSPALQELYVTDNPSTASSFGKSTTQILIEVGPHGALAGFVKQTLGRIQGRLFQYIPTLSRGKDSVDTMFNFASRLVVSGYAIDLQAVNDQRGDRRSSVLVNLPTYSWDHSTSYWHESRLSRDYRKRSSPRHPLLGAPTPDFNTLEPSWRNIIRVSEIPWIRGHVIQSSIVYPAAGYVAMAVEACAQRGRLNRPGDKIADYILKNIIISKPILVPEDAEGIETQFVLRPYNRSARQSSDTWDEFRVFSYTKSDGWSEHCRGLVSLRYNKDCSEVEGDREAKCKSSRYARMIDLARSTCTSETIPTHTYETLARLGITYSGAFSSMEDAAVRLHQSLGHVRIPDTASVMPGGIEHPHVIHPSTLDVCMQMTSPVLIEAGVLQSPMVPTSIEAIVISSDVPAKAGERLLVHTDLQLQGKRSFKSDITASRENPDSIIPPIEILGLVCTAVPGSVSASHSLESRGRCHKLEWEVLADPIGDEHNESTNNAGGVKTIGALLPVTLLRPKCLSEASESIISSLALTLGDRIIGSTSDIKDVAEKGLNGQICVCLAEIDNPSLERYPTSEWNALRQMLSSASKVLWVTRGGTMRVDNPNAGLITGLARSARSDNNALHLITFDLDPNQSAPDETARLLRDCLDRCFGDQEQNRSIQDMEFTERSGQIFIPRVVQDRNLQNYIAPHDSEPQIEVQKFIQPVRSLRLEVATPGLLDSLHFVEDPTPTTRLAANELRMKPQAYGVNFRDVMIALGQLEETSIMSSEHSGVITEVGQDLACHLQVGDRICAWGGQSYASSVTVNGDSVHRIPDDMTFEAAASIPIVYATVYYGLVHIARLQKGESILIHSAAGGVGQAAVMLAKHLEANVFVTVGSNEKKDLVMRAYGIPDERIFSSRQLSFAAGIKRLTNGRGVDVVLNSIAGEALHETLECLSKLGRFVEIGKRDILADTRLDMGSFNKSITFASVDLHVVFEHDPILAKRMIREVFSLLASGAVQHVQPLNLFSLSELESAFRFIQAGKHTGKVVLTADDNTMVKVPAYWTLKREINS